MSSTVDYNELLPEIQSIIPEKTVAPTIPVDVYVQEAENLYHWSLDDQAALSAAGLAPVFITTLPVRAGACREAQSLWIREQKMVQKAEKEWKVKAPAAFDLRDQMVHAFRYAFRNHDDLSGSVEEIALGDSSSDMVQDLNDLSVLGKAHVDLLSAVAFDLGLLDTAASVSDEMGDLLGATNGERRSDSEALVLRNKAYTYLKQAMDEIRACGKYVFWRKSDRFDGYTSDYWRRMHAAAEKHAEQDKV